MDKYNTQLVNLIESLDEAGFVVGSIGPGVYERGFDVQIAPKKEPTPESEK